jgi:lipopolysaccharide export system protein LptA
MVLGLAAMAVLGIHRARLFSAPVAEVSPGQGGVEGSDPVVGEYTGFEYVESVAGELVFALRSVRTLGKASGWHEIEGVRLQLYNAGEEGPILTCEGASFNIETRDARMRGPVHVEFPSGAILTTDTGHFEAGTRRFVTDSEVLFMNGDTVGQAGRATYSLSDNRLMLEDSAVVEAGSGVALNARRIIYQRNGARIVFPDGCRLARAGASVEAPTASVLLEDDSGSPRRIEFRGGVRVRQPGGPTGGAIDAWAEKIAAERDSSGNWQLDASSRGPWIEVVFGLGEVYFERTLKTQRLRGVLGPDGLINLRAEGSACLAEIPREGAPRVAESINARVWFSDGEASDVELTDEVVLRGEGVDARGFRARVSPSAGLTMLHGDPTGPQRALLESERGRISCDQAQMFDRDGRIEARGSVQGQLYDVVILGTEASEGQGPVRFAADLLDITESGSSFRLREGARLWQGHRLVLADNVLFRQESEIVEATGHVRVTLPVEQLQPQAEPGDDVVVVARSLRYDRSDQLATFRGNVRYSDPGYVLSATELMVSFDAHNTITTVDAVGSVELVEMGTGRRMTAQRARRDLMTQIVHATGEPVQLTDADGTKVSSSSLTWDQTNGSVTVAGGTETVYYPEEEP